MYTKPKVFLNLDFLQNSTHFFFTLSFLMPVTVSVLTNCTSSQFLTVVVMNEKENWRILTTQEIYAMVKKKHYNRDNKVKQITLVWACREN